TVASSAAAISRTPHSASPSAPSARWSPTCSCPAVAAWWPSTAWTGTAIRSFPAAGAGSCCSNTAATTSSSTCPADGPRCPWSCPRRSDPTTSVRPGTHTAPNTEGPTAEAAIPLRPPPAGREPVHDRPRSEPGTVEAFDAVDVIAAKRDGRALSKEQIDWVIDAYTRGVVAEEQMAALSMAIFINDMEASEIADWTQAMIASGERMDFSSLSRPTSDKHSTGGVG